MKKLINIISVAAVALFAVGCSDWTEPEALVFEGSMDGSYHGEEYYANLRAYKASKHTICFGWFSEWSGVGQGDTRLMALPDSIDLISLWGGWASLTPEKYEDLNNVRKIKGTRVMPCVIINNVGKDFTPPEVDEDWIVDGVQYDSQAEARAAFWGWYQASLMPSQYVPGTQYGDSSDEGIENAIRKYARAIVDTIHKYDYDGFDIDWESGQGFSGNISYHKERMLILFDELSKYLGPKSGTDKLLCLDGNVNSLDADGATKVDYFLIQAYGTTTDASVSSGRITPLYSAYNSVYTRRELVEKTVLTCNFESGAATGGCPCPGFTSAEYYTNWAGEHIKMIVGFAQYYDQESQTKVGGFGAFRFGYDYANTVDGYAKYGYFRKSIQCANPAVK